MFDFPMVSKSYSKLLQNTPSSVLDNIYKSSLEYLVYNLFKINIINLIKTKVSLVKNFHLSPSEIDRMMMWEYEYFIDAVNDNIKEENARAEDEKGNFDTSKYSPDRMMRSAQAKMPNMSNMKMPSMPKFG